MALSAEDATRLAKLTSAYDALITGAKVARVTLPDGRTVEYGAGDMGKLKAEIDQLNAQNSSSGYARGSLRFTV